MPDLVFATKGTAEAIRNQEKLNEKAAGCAYRRMASAKLYDW